MAAALRLIPDQAIGEANSSRKDGLGFGDYAEVLAGVAVETRGPFTIGIFGEWGTGKTSLMRLMERRLSSHDDVVTVWFNAWRYEQEEHPIVPLVGTIVRELERRRMSSSRRARAFDSLIRSLRAIAYGFSAKSTFKVPGFAEVEASFVAKDMIDRDEQLTRDPLLDRSLYYGAFSALEAVRLGDDLRIVVLVDDLDRCFPDMAIKLLESIKLVLAQPGFIFVLGVAREVIEGYLQHRYTTEYGIADFDGKLYLDKIVQLPFHIPAATALMTEFCAALLDGQEQNIQAALAQLLPRIAEALGGNPRSVLRFLNNILVDAAISSRMSSDSATAIPLPHIAISRFLQVGWPELLAEIQSAPDLATVAATWQPKELPGLAAHPGRDGNLAGRLLSDHALRDVLLGDAGRDWLARRQVRDASVRFLRQQRRITALGPAEQALMYDAFLSYDSQDRAAVTEVVEVFAGRGLRTYSYRDLAPGENLETALSAALQNSRALCVFIGAATLKSNWALLDVRAMAARADNIPLIPVILPGVDTSKLPDYLQERQWADWRESNVVAEAGKLADFLLSLR